MPFTCSKKIKLLISSSTHSKNKNKLVAGSTKLGTACQVDPMSAERLGIFVFRTVGAAAPSPSSLPVHATVLCGTARHKHFTSIHPYELRPTRRLINTHWLYANYQSRLDPSTFKHDRKPNVGDPANCLGKGADHAVGGTPKHACSVSGCLPVPSLTLRLTTLDASMAN